MATLYGAWLGSPYQARIRLDYGVTYTADHTQAIYNGDFSVEFEASVSDSVNLWGRSGDCGAASGSNVSYQIPSGGGRKIFNSFSGVYKYGNASVAAYVDNIEAVGGGVINGSFTIPSGPLAPYFTNTNYGTRDVTSSGFKSTGISATGNGGTLNNVQMEVNTSASDTGAVYFTAGSWTDATATGLLKAKTYYYRIRVSNSTYGWGAWGPWKTVTTLSTVPSAPSEAWSFVNISQIDAGITGISVPDNGGIALDQILVRYSTDPAFATYTDLPLAGTATATTLSGLTPGTTYYVKIYAHNANGYSAATSVKSFTTLPGVMVNVGGVWKTAVPYVNVNGVWKPATRYVNVGGVWKQ